MHSDRSNDTIPQLNIWYYRNIGTLANHTNVLIHVHPYAYITNLATSYDEETSETLRI